MEFIVSKSTMLITSGPDHDPDKMHLHVVLTDPYPETQEVLMVNICSVPINGEGYDDTCILTPQNCSHDFIIKDSYVAYRYLSIATEARLLEGIRKEIILPRDPLPDNAFSMITDGVMKSFQSAPRYKNFYQLAINS